MSEASAISSKLTGVYASKTMQVEASSAGAGMEKQEVSKPVAAKKGMHSMGKTGMSSFGATTAQSGLGSAGFGSVTISNWGKGKSAAPERSFSQSSAGHAGGGGGGGGGGRHHGAKGGERKWATPTTTGSEGACDHASSLQLCTWL
jgi:hypothetical protein